MRSISTGSKSLDEMMKGGFLAGTINLVAGHAGAGKTTLLLQTILKLAEEEKKGAFFYLDTESGFHVDRLAGMAQSTGQDPEAIKKRLVFYQARSLADQHRTVLDTWPDDAERLKPLALLVDSIAFYYQQQLTNVDSTHLGSKSRELTGKLATEITHLLNLATKHDAPAIVVTWTRSPASHAFRQEDRRKLLKTGEFSELDVAFDIRTIDIIGGRNLEYASKTVLRLLPIKNADRSLAILEKHVIAPTPRLAVLEITERGLVDTDSKVYKLDEYWSNLIEKESRKQEPIQEERRPVNKPKERIQAKQSDN